MCHRLPEYRCFLPVLVFAVDDLPPRACVASLLGMTTTSTSAPLAGSGPSLASTTSSHASGTVPACVASVTAGCAVIMASSNQSAVATSADLLSTVCGVSGIAAVCSAQMDYSRIVRCWSVILVFIVCTECKWYVISHIV